MVTKRSLTLDVSKGLLVLVMLLHHAWSAVYKSGPDHVRSVLSFISSAFILYAGFLLGLFLLDEYIRLPLHRMRMDMTRGVRLMFIFLLFNAVLYFTGYLNIPVQASFLDWLAVCMGPNPPFIAVLSLLNAFAYFFFFSAILLYLCVKIFSKWGDDVTRLGVALSSLGVAGLLFLTAKVTGPASLLASTTLYGFLGIFFAIAAKYFVSRYPQATGLLGLSSLVTYLLLLVLTFGNFFYPYRHYGLFVLIASLAVWKASVLLAERRKGVIVRSLAFLGAYTLVAYVIQVIVSKLIDLGIIDLYRFVSGVWQAFALSLVVMSFLMILSILFMHELRKKSSCFNRVYRMFFG